MKAIVKAETRLDREAPSWFAVGVRETLRVELTLEHGKTAEGAEVVAYLATGWLPRKKLQPDGGQIASADPSASTTEIRRREQKQAFDAEIVTVPFESMSIRPRRLVVATGTELITTIVVYPKWLVQVTSLLAVAAACYAVLRLGWLVTNLAETGFHRTASKLVGAASSLPAVVTLLRVVRGNLVPSGFKLDAWLTQPFGLAAYATVLFLAGRLGPPHFSVLRNDTPAPLQFTNQGGSIGKGASAAVFGRVTDDWMKRQLEDEKHTLCAARFDLDGRQLLGAPINGCSISSKAHEPWEWLIVPMSPAPQGIAFRCALKTWKLGVPLWRRSPLAVLEGVVEPGIEEAREGVFVRATKKDSCELNELGAKARVAVDIGAFAKPELPAERAGARVLVSGALAVEDARGPLTKIFSHSFQIREHGDLQGGYLVTLETKPRLEGNEVEWVRIDYAAGRERPERRFPAVSATPTFTMLIEGLEAGTLEARAPELVFHFVWSARAKTLRLVDPNAPNDAVSVWRDGAGNGLRFLALAAPPGKRLEALLDATERVRLPRDVAPSAVRHVHGDQKADCPLPDDALGVEIDVTNRARPACIPYPTRAAPLKRGCCLREVLPVERCTAGGVRQEVTADRRHIALQAGCDPETVRWR
jgi:hypothetical protein